MKKILLTGASGFIGRHCLPFLLENGYEVHALSLAQLPEFSEDVVWHTQNLLDIESTKHLIESVRPTHCLHLAWHTEPGKYWTSSENLDWISASISLLQSFYKNGGERFVGAGTCAEYDWRYGYCSEAFTPLAPGTLYGVAKYAFQKILHSYSENFSLSSAWGRVFFLYGPHEHPARLTSSVIASLLRGEPALCSPGNQIRDFMHVADVGGAFVRLLESEVKGEVNIASGKPVSVKDFIGIIARQINGIDRVKLGALPARNEPAMLVADISRLKDEVGYTPHFDLEAGLSQTIAWWKETLEKK
jgi:nucleoside-diphosphate-sugar epimerase